MRERQLGRKSAQVSKRQKTVSEPAPWKLLLWTAIAGLVFGLIGFGEIAEDYLRSTRNSLHPHRASGEIVLVLIDDQSLRQVGNWPWRRQQDAVLLDRLTASGAKRIFMDINLSFPSTPQDDTALADALQRAGRVTLFARSEVGQQKTAKHIDGRPLPIFTRHAKLALATFYYNYQNAVWRLPWSGHVGGEKVPSFAAALANSDGKPGATFPIDYSIQVESIPAFSALDVLNGRVSGKQLAGKDVVVGTGSEILNDNFYVPGYGRAFGVQVHALGAETLKEGHPVDLGWFLTFLFGVAAAGLGATRRRASHRLTTFAAAVVLLLAGPVFLEAHLYFVDITPGLFVLLLVGGVLTWRRFRVRGLVNPLSNLPNLNALRVNKAGRQQALIAARILNYEEIVASLQATGERQLVDQIVSRLSVGASKRTLYQGDGGIFAWFEEPRAPFGNHLDALYALFRNPARVDGLSLDLTIAFGVEVGSSRSLPNRLASALVAAEEAAHDGLKWKYHDPESLQDVSWKLSMLSQLDSAIDRGEVWVAYQPKLDLRTRRIIGAEALARWTHPEKGPIAASEFVAAAEQHDRIGKLTDFVLEKAVAAAASINKRGGEFGMAVNLSARLLTDKGFTLRVSALLARHRLAPEHLTLELTETAALTDSGEGLEMIASLRQLGIRISIDDYGTGLSTLDYLKKIPANEIKIDQSFVKAMIDNRSDRLMVQSTIGLAHSLGRQVVAEGVEQSEILDALVAMGCDIAQGYAIGRPMSLESLIKRISGDRRRSAA
jgi:EAL domain-containing protein (putative c-di-GMP-specific phosphodiesterase class I)/CHASE2 domain-containing sensor protein